MLLAMAAAGVQAQNPKEILRQTRENGWEFDLKAGINIGGFSPLPLPVEILVPVKSRVEHGNGVVVAVDVIVGVVNLGFQPVNISFVIGLRNQKHRVQGCVFRVGGETRLTPVFVAVNKLLCHGIHPGQPHDFLFLAIAVGGQLIDLADCIQKSHRFLLFQKRGAPGSPSDSYSLLSILSMFSS